jgi:hypothetical protein
VSRAQFDAEFEAAKEIWERVARARATVGAINSPFHPEGETEPQRLQRFYDARGVFTEAHNELVRAIGNGSPFYPEEIYKAVDALRLRTGLEQSQLNTRRPLFAPASAGGLPDPDWYQHREKAKEEIEARADAVSAAIRMRLASIVLRD